MKSYAHLRPPAARTRAVLLAAGILALGTILTQCAKSGTAPGTGAHRPEEPAPAAEGTGPIVIDPGHGGEDTGAVVDSHTESVLVLQVALKVRDLLAERDPTLPVQLTRDSDVFVPLKGRMEMANRLGARLFLSIHANSGKRVAARGFETYLLSAEATDSEAHRVALAENSVLEREGMSPQDPLFETLLSLASAEQLRLSEQFAGIIHTRLTAGLGATSRGVKQAPFFVLTRAQMPSVLVEIGFLTNKEERGQLFDGAYQHKIAASLVDGILEYERRFGPSRQAREEAPSVSP